MKYSFLLLLLIFNLFFLKAQENLNPNGYNIFYNDDGIKLSEGYLNNGKPNDFWISYYDNGIIKSEGNWKFGLLDSLWIFYYDNGNYKEKVNYKNGLKEGLNIKFRINGTTISETDYLNDKKDGLEKLFDLNNKLNYIYEYDKGIKDGIGFQYDSNGIIIKEFKYKNDALLFSQDINRYDIMNRKVGKWKEYFSNFQLKSENYYIKGQLHGFQNYYTSNGSLIRSEKYIYGVLQEEIKETSDLDTKMEFYPNASLKYRGTFQNGIAEGVHRFYSQEGKIDSSKIYNNGKLIGCGIVNEYGKRQGFWKEFYETGELRSEGNYKDSKRIKYWKYYYLDGKLEQEGNFIDGLFDGQWKWYFQSGSIHRIENFYLGIEEGYSVEYHENGEILEEGYYIDGEKDGKWIFNSKDFKEEGKYFNGLKQGEWKSWFLPKNKLSFNGNYEGGLPNGVHVYYYLNGQIKLIGKYDYGLKTGEWKYYNQDGIQVLSIFYKNGIEVKYEGVRIKPSFEEDLKKENNGNN